MSRTHLMRGWAAAALAVAVSVAAPACGDDGSEGADAGITVVDARGRTVSLSGVPDRITVAGRAAFMIVDAVYLFEGAGDRLAAFELGRDSQIDFVGIVDPHLDDKQILPKSVGAEQVAATDPDLVLMKSYMAGELGEPLERLGIPVLYLDLETPAQYERDLETLGVVLGEPEQADEIIRFYRERVDRIASVTGAISDDERPDVLVLRYDPAEGTAAFDVPPASWLQTEMVEIAGGSPVWTGDAGGSGWTRVGFEQIAAWDPDQIFLISYSGDPAALAEDLTADGAWREVRAVSDGSVLGWPGDLSSWDQPDTRWVLGLTWLFTKIQPGPAAGIDIMAETSDLFTGLYRLTPEAVRLEVLPLLVGSLP